MKTNEDIRHKRAEQKRAYRKTHQTVNLSFLNDEASEIDKKANDNGMDIPKYLKALVKADLNGKATFLSPQQEKKIADVIIEIKRVGNNINQLIRNVHTSKEVRYEDIRALQQRLTELEKNVIDMLSNPREAIEQS
jgi:hypothetical protein